MKRKIFAVFLFTLSSVCFSKSFLGPLAGFSFFDRVQEANEKRFIESDSYFLLGLENYNMFGKKSYFGFYEKATLKTDFSNYKIDLFIGPSFCVPASDFFAFYFSPSLYTSSIFRGKEKRFSDEKARYIDFTAGIGTEAEFFFFTKNKIVPFLGVDFTFSPLCESSVIIDKKYYYLNYDDFYEVAFSSYCGFMIRL